MKKTLIALATLAVASGAAMAQSSVEIYGYLDVGVAKFSGAQLGLNNTAFTVPASQAATALTNAYARSGLTTNYIGFRGTEDLGGGMKATFNLQTGGLDLSTGSNALAFSRESNLGLTGGFGALKIGRSVSTMCSAGCSFDYNGIGNGDAYALLGLSPASIKASSRRSNQIEYTAPAMSGVTARVATILKGDGTEDITFGNGLATAGTAFAGGVGSAGNATAHVKGDYKAVYALSLNYANGPIRVAYALETQPFTDANLRNSQWTAAEYDFGVAKANLSYMVNGTKGGEGRGGAQASVIGSTPLSSVAGASSGKGFGAGVSVPMGAVTFGLQYANNTENKTKATELFARYSLSKRTEIYSYYAITSGVNATTSGAFAANNVLVPTSASDLTPKLGTVATNGLIAAGMPANPTLFGLGVRHSF